MNRTAWMISTGLLLAGCSGVREGTVSEPRPENAEYVFARAAARHPKNASAWESLGWYGILESADLDDASAALTRALELEPDRPMSLWGRFLLSEDHGDIAAALATAEAILQGPRPFALRDVLVVRLQRLRELGLSAAAEAEVVKLLEPVGSESGPGSPEEPVSAETSLENARGSGPASAGIPSSDRQAELRAKYREATLAWKQGDAGSAARVAALRECHRLYPRFAHVAAELAEAESALNLRRQAYRSALSSDPAHLRARVGLAAMLMDQDLTPLASREMQDAIRRYPRTPMVLVGWARLELASGHRLAAMRLCEDALFTAPAFLPALRLLLREGRELRTAAQQEELARRSLDLAPNDPEMTALLTAALLESGKPGEAAALKGADQEAVISTEQRRERMEALIQSDPERARNEVTSLLAKTGLDDLLLARRVALAIGDQAQATELLSRAAQLAPEDLRVQGSWFLTNQTAAVEDSSTEAEPWAAIPAEFDGAGFSSLVLYNLKSVEVHDNGSVDTRRRIVVRVLEGRPELARWSFDYDPDEQEIHVIRAERRAPGGALVEVGRPLDEPSPLVAETNARLYLNHRKLSVVFGSVAPDEVIDIEVAMTGSGQSAGQWQGDFALLGTAAPTWLGVYELTVPRAMNVTARGFGAPPPSASKSERDDRTVHRFEARGVPGVRFEPMMPNPIEKLPYVVTSTSPSYEHIADWYRKLSGLDRAVSREPRVSNLASKLCGSEPDETELTVRARRAYEYVRDHIRYLGFEFGHYDFKPHSPEEVCQARYGDCKDQSRLLVELLRHCGVDAEMVLLRTRSAGRVGDSIPYVGLFNHAIIYLPSLDLYADSTAPDHRLGELPADDLDAMALHVRPGSVLGRTPRPTAAEHTREVRMRLRLTGGAGRPIVGQGRREVTHTGLFCPPVRAAYATQPGAIEPLELGGAALEAGDIQREDDANRIHVSYRLKFPLVGDALRLDLAPFDVATLIDLEPGRVQPLRLRHPMTFRSEVELDLYGLEGTIEIPPPVTLQAPGARYRFEARKTQEKLLVLSEELVLDRLDVPTSELGPWNELLQRVDALQRTTIRFLPPA